MRAYEEMQYDKWAQSLDHIMPALLEKHLLMARQVSHRDTYVVRTASISVESDDSCEYRLHTHVPTND